MRPVCPSWISTLTAPSPAAAIICRIDPARTSPAANTPATEVRVEASGVEVEALRAAAGEQARIAAEDEDAARRQAAHDDALASRYTEGIARRADA